jgi:hypothetical protein
LPQTLAVPPPPQTGALEGQSLFWQQDVPPPVGAPGMHAQVSAAAQSAAPPTSQQMSAAFAQVFAAFVQVEETHAPLVVSQIVAAPFVGSFWHWTSVVHLPHALAVVSPQISPAVVPVQSASVLQLPATHSPAVSQTYAVAPAPP